jgi:hypothetical protein
MRERDEAPGRGYVVPGHLCGQFRDPLFSREQLPGQFGDLNEPLVQLPTKFALTLLRCSYKRR